MTDDLVAWLADVIDQEHERWSNPWEGPDSQRRSGLARVEAERAVVALHSDTYQLQRRVHGEHVNSIGVTVPNFEPIDVWACRLCSDADDGPETWPCPTLRALAYGHRYDAEGFRDEWKPSGV